MPPLVVIVGETASGKTALAIELAKRFNGEIISADSRTVYRGMDIGTAKPALAERQGIAHYGFDVVNPDERFSAQDFQRLALAAIADIYHRGKLPIMVGGTGLYIDAVLYNFQFRPAPNAEVRAALQRLSVEQLQQKVLAAGLPLPRNDRNPRHLTRLLESGVPPEQPRALRDHTLVIGLSTPRELLRQRITARVDAMVAAGLVEEVRRLREQCSQGCEALLTPGYRAFGAYLDGDIDLEEAKRQFVSGDLRLAKRQRTWFARNPDIHWLSGDDKLAQAALLVGRLIRR